MRSLDHLGLDPGISPRPRSVPEADRDRAEARAMASLVLLATRSYSIALWTAELPAVSPLASYNPRS